jgi:hypothetical protein
MAGLSGIELPTRLYALLGPLAGFLPFVRVSTGISAHEWAFSIAWAGALVIGALALPNTLQVMSRYEPALGFRSPPTWPSRLRVLDWAPTIPWAVAISCLVIGVVMSLGGRSEFLYWQF